MRRGVAEEAFPNKWFPGESSNARSRAGRKGFDAAESSADAMRLAAVTGPGRSEDALRKFAGRTSGSSSRPQLLCEPRLLLPCSPDIKPEDSWHGEVWAVFGASQAWTWQKTLQTGATSKSNASAQVAASFAQEQILAHNFMKSGYASKLTASTRQEPAFRHAVHGAQSNLRAKNYR